MNIDDADGNQMWRVAVMTNQLEAYVSEARKQGFAMKKFVYDYEKYKQDQEIRTKLE